jgi:hypothetical protein
MRQYMLLVMLPKSVGNMRYLMTYVVLKVGAYHFMLRRREQRRHVGGEINELASSKSSCSSKLVCVVEAADAGHEVLFGSE